jgi:NADH-quinone oxidoreductase subunit H
MQLSTILFFLPLLLVFTVFAVYAERKVSAFIQDRYGPMEVGYYGLIQTVADLLKLIQKEDIVPTNADKKLFLIAPVVIFVAVFAGFAVMPVGPTWSGISVSSGVFFLLAIVALDVIGIMMAGWGANNKYALFGSLRAVAQIVSYEIPVGLSVLAVVMVCQTLDLQEISFQQGIFAHDMTSPYLFGMSSWNINVYELGGFFAWNIVKSPFLVFVFIIFFVATLAESNRAPFDLPEAESELVAGFHTEYSGFRWAIVMLSEYGMMLLSAILGVVLFLGSWNTPLPNVGTFALANWTSGELGALSGVLWPVFWLLTKSIGLVVVQMWVRWTFPRVRMDQLMNLSWKYLTPASLILIFIAGFWRLVVLN